MVHFEDIEENGIIFVLSEPGTGKTSLLMAFLKHIYFTSGKRRMECCQRTLEEINEGRKALGKVPFEIPSEPPLYTSMDCPERFQVGYEEFYEPYVINPYYIGVNTYEEAQFLLPYSVVAIPEFQKYTNSRRTFTLPERFYRVFEIHRHWHLLFILDGHKGSFIDLRVRALTKHIIEIQKQEHERDERGRIIKTIWHCREFHSVKDYDAYITRDEPTYSETTYENEGNIFNCYDSYSSKDEFIPPEGKVFSLLKPIRDRGEIAQLPKEIAKYYELGEPASFRGKEKKEEEKKEKKGEKSSDDGQASRAAR